ncbi:SRPBCC domain-containing protein [Micromonospora sp. NPDC048170]|uniref:SRPBCC family protein n=1 Tax=Micromonospora sp. NPDC048170 TaxID=3154819 RepID=UPI0033EEE917
MIERTIWIEAPPEVVWRFFTDPARMARWLGPADLDPTPGGELTFQLSDGPRPVVRGRFTELRPYEKIVFTFGWDPTPGVPDLPPGSSQVEVTLSAQAGGTLLTLHHISLPPNLVADTCTGWTGFLGTLKAEAANA